MIDNDPNNDWINNEIKELKINTDSSEKKIGTCQYCHPRGDDTEKELFQCKYCKGWFCEEHSKPRKPMLAPFKSTDIEKHAEWNKKGGHPCIDYLKALTDKEKISHEKLVNLFNRPYGKVPKPTVEHVTYPVISRPYFGKDETRICKFCFKKSDKLTRCEYCGDFFCNDHIKPKTMHDFLRSKGGHSCTPYSNQFEKREKDREPQTEKLKEKDENHSVFNIIGIILVIVLLLSLWLLYNQINESVEQSSILSAISTNMGNLNNQLNSLNYEISSTETNLQTVCSKIQLLRNGSKYDLHNPTYPEVTSFLAKDKTNTKTYSSSSYNCAYFSRDVNNNAESKGIRCAYVELSFPGTGHAIVAFQTTDRGLVYFEPQHDVRASIVIGKRFYTCLSNMPGYYWVAPSYDDTIEDIIEFW